MATAAARPPAQPTLFGVKAPEVYPPHATCRWDAARRAWAVRLTDAGRAFVDAFLERHPRPESVLRKVNAAAYHALSRRAADDLHSVALHAVSRAACSWVPGRGKKFSAYAADHVHKYACELIDRRRRAARVSGPEARGDGDADPDAGRDLERCLAALDAATVLARLPAPDARLVCDLSGLGRRRRTLAEVGRSLGVSKTAVANRVKRIAEAFAGRD